VTTTGDESDFAGVTQAKAVWDFSTGDGKIFLERLRLIKSAIELQNKGYAFMQVD
jgi:hypothetical protein